MLEVSKCSAVETLRNGRRVEIRALQPEDREDFIAAVSSISAQSLYRRFFAARRAFTEKQTSFFLNVDFVNHVALIAVMEEDGRPVIVGGGRYVVSQSRQAEVAFVVVDQYQGQGIGAALMHHLGAIARESGLRELIADVLPDNIPMLKTFEKSGFPKVRNAKQVLYTLRFGFLINRSMMIRPLNGFERERYSLPAANA